MARVAKRVRSRPGMEVCKGCNTLVKIADMCEISDTNRKRGVRRCTDCTWTMVRLLAVRPDPSVPRPQGSLFGDEVGRHATPDPT